MSEAFGYVLFCNKNQDCLLNHIGLAGGFCFKTTLVSS